MNSKTMTQGTTVKQTIDGLRYTWFRGGLPDSDFLVQLREAMQAEANQHITLPKTEGC